MTPQEDELHDAELNYIQHFLLEQTGIALEKNSLSLVLLRLTTLLRTLHLTPMEMIEKLRAAPTGPVANALVDSLTTSETSFFRDRTPFDLLEKSILPQIVATNPPSLSIWSAACATGQEALSIAITVAEHFPHLLLQTRILASDISQTALLQAQSGEYSELEVNRGLPVRMLMKYFTRAGRSWRAKSVLMSRILFRDINLMHNHLTEKFDVVFLRNVLIYLSDAAKRSVLQNVAHCMSAGSYLVLGASETVFGVSNLFETVRFGSNLCYRLKK